MVDSEESFGSTFNIIRMVEDHVPPRLEAINKELGKLYENIEVLKREQKRLEQLMCALDINE